jgi:hypothetical protein
VVVGDAVLKPPLEEAEGDRRSALCALAMDHRIEVAVPTDIGGLATVEDVVLGGAGVGLPPDHPTADASPAKDVVQQEPDVETYRWIADEKQGPGGFEYALQIFQRDRDRGRSAFQLPAVF